MLTGTWLSDGGVLDAEFAAGPITDGTLRVETQAITPAPRPDPRYPLALISDGPYGIDLGELAAVIEPCADLSEPLRPLCSAFLEHEALEAGPGDFARRVQVMALYLGRLSEAESEADGDAQRNFPTFRVAGVIQVLERLARRVEEDPADPERMTALVRFFNYNVGVHG